jgi:hypothetical protein
MEATREAIYAAYESDADDGHRAHLGASIIGKSCEQALWFDFRWVTKARHPGQLLRRFESGQLEEARLVANLRRAGASVLDVDPQTGRQFRVSDQAGHFGGSLDALVIRLRESPDQWHVAEFKTHNAKSYKELIEKRLRLAKPQHFDQMQIYMHLNGAVWGIYVAVNKDTDDLYLERVRYDQAHALRLTERARRVIFAAEPTLPKVSQDPTWYECRFCDHHSVCHQTKPTAPVAVNCRTCLYSSPVGEVGGNDGANDGVNDGERISGGTDVGTIGNAGTGVWTCGLHQAEIDSAAQRTGCSRHLYIPALIGAKQVDFGDGFVEYEFADGRRARDTGIDKSLLINARTSEPI